MKKPIIVIKEGSPLHLYVFDSEEYKEPKLLWEHTFENAPLAHEFTCTNVTIANEKAKGMFHPTGELADVKKFEAFVKKLPAIKEAVPSY